MSQSIPNYFRALPVRKTLPKALPAPTSTESLPTQILTAATDCFYLLFRLTLRLSNIVGAEEIQGRSSGVAVIRPVNLLQTRRRSNGKTSHRPDGKARPSLPQSGQPATSALRHPSQLVCFPNESRATAVLPPRLTPPPYSRSPPAPLRLGFEARPAGETGKSRRNSHCVSRPPSRAAYPIKESGVALRHDGFS